jgi:hypothetical protein
MDDRIVEKIRTLVDEAYSAGIAQGRELARDDLIRRLSEPEPAVKRTRAPRGPRTQPPHPSTMPLPAHQREAAAQAAVEPPRSHAREESLVGVVNKALISMPAAEDGVDPDALTNFIRTHNGNGESDLKVADVRGALRQMLIAGTARRVGRGRYIAAEPPTPGSFL